MKDIVFERKAEQISDYKLKIFHVDSIFENEDLMKDFLKIKANVIDLNPALVKKCITGTEQDFIMLMDRAKHFIRDYLNIKDTDREKDLLQMFSDCVFGYYVITPLLNAKEISDIKIYSYDHITVKVKGKRFVSDITFPSQRDFDTWYDRILYILRLQRGAEYSLQHMTDRKNIKDFYLRVDTQFDTITSTDENNLHIRKTPKEKYSWDYLIANHMLDQSMVDYITDRINAGYGFLISGCGGSGKTSLLNNMIDTIPFDESVLIVQESDELYSNIHPQMQFEHTLSVIKEGISKDYSLEDELRLGLLQDIDNFVIGEIKGGEALSVFTTALSTGARFFGTIHSNTARSSVIRLAQLARYVSDYPMETLEEMLSCVPFVLIHLSDFAIDEIVEITGWEDKEKRLIFKEIS